MNRFILLFCFSLSTILALSQGKPVQLGENASDCLGALLLNDTIVGPVYSPRGFGKKLEISDYALGDPYFIEREHNTVWYKFIAPYDATFTFDLMPIRKDDDFDFLLFQYDGPNFCQDIMDGRKIPIRTNISRKNIEVQGMTGLKAGNTDEYMPSGPGSSYSKPVQVRKGEIFYLLVDNPFRENEGHSIYLHFRPLDFSAASENGAAEDEGEFILPLRKLVVTVKDKKSGERIASNIAVDGLPDSVQSKYAALSQIRIDVVSYRSYSINAVKKGYLLASQSFVPKNDSVYEVELSLKPMQLGDRINLENIKFDSDNTEILEKSLPALQQVKAFLEINPSITIEVQGHVNGESKRNKRKYRKLSEARAKAIYTKLVEAGVAASRMSVQGFGNAKMIFPTPISNRQAEANRRVEIEILSL